MKAKNFCQIIKCYWEEEIGLQKKQMFLFGKKLAKTFLREFLGHGRDENIIFAFYNRSIKI